MRKRKKRVNVAAWAVAAVILFFVVVAIFAEQIAPYDPSALGPAYLAPSQEHLLGTNDLGQDIFSELVFGTRVSLLIGIFSALIVTVVGTVLALISGYMGGKIDRLITAVTNIAMAVPSLPLTMLLIAYLKSPSASPPGPSPPGSCAPGCAKFAKCPILRSKRPWASKLRSSCLSTSCPI